MNLHIEKLIYGGDGLSRDAGQVILTPFVAAGETVEATLEAAQSGVQRAALTQVLEPAPERVAAPCPYFAACGGCHYQHLDYASQLATKRAILAETLRRVGKLDFPEDRIQVVSAEPYGYRNRVQLHVDNRRIGFRQMRSHQLKPIDHCPISSPRLNECIAALSRLSKQAKWPRFLESIELFTNEADVQINVNTGEQRVGVRFFEWCEQEMGGVVEGPLHYMVGETVHRVSGGAFFQVNRFLLERMVELAVGDAAGERALDLYAGVGLFSIPLARRFRQVTAVESGTVATKDLRHTADTAGVNVRVQTATVDRFLDTLDEPADFVLADPPRAGLGKHVTRRLLELAPRRISLVSCDPSTLARDAATLQAGGYRIEKLTLLDLFPQTFHIETVALLSKEPATD